MKFEYTMTDVKLRYVNVELSLAGLLHNAMHEKPSAGHGYCNSIIIDNQFDVNKKNKFGASISL